MDEVLVFLRARLDEEAAVATDATPGPWWHHPGKQWLGPEAFEKYDLRHGEEFVGYGGPHPFTGAVCSTGPASNMQGMKDASHIARHDPARVLREVEAKRRTLVRCEEAMLSANPMLVHFAKQTAWEMAQPFRDHPGFKPGWAPIA